MKPSIKNNIFLLSLILILGATGCVRTKLGKTVNNVGNTALKDDTQLGILQEPTPLSESLKSTPGVQTGRYSSVIPKPTDSQRELLQVIITVSIPEDIRNIGQTLRYLLKRSGYQLEDPQVNQLKLSEFLYKPLPNVHRRLGPMTLEDALTVLTAPAFILNEDPVRRVISYKLDELYARGEL